MGTVLLKDKKDFKVNIDYDVQHRITTMAVYAETEIGGFLLGSFEEDDKGVTQIRIDDLKTIMGFEEGVGDKAAYDMSADAVAKFYDEVDMNDIIGWWHTHPGSSKPSPSQQDIESDWDYDATDRPFVCLIGSKGDKFRTDVRHDDRIYQDVDNKVYVYADNDGDMAYVKAMNKKCKELMEASKSHYNRNRQDLFSSNVGRNAYARNSATNVVKSYKATKELEFDGGWPGLQERYHSHMLTPADRKALKAWNCEIMLVRYDESLAGLEASV
jgi:proteasome lid subunit RPN8/RPN11